MQTKKHQADTTQLHARRLTGASTLEEPRAQARRSVELSIVMAMVVMLAITWCASLDRTVLELYQNRLAEADPPASVTMRVTLSEAPATDVRYR